MMNCEPWVLMGTWWALALVTAGLAQAKNRQGLVWFLLAMFLGPVAVLILVVFCPKVEVIAGRYGGEPIALPGEKPSSS